MRILSSKQVSEEFKHIIGKKPILMKKLVEAGISVPQYFVISNELFENISNSPTFESKQVLKIKFPDKIIDEIYKSYVKLGYDPERVRSAFDLLKSNREPTVAVRCVDSNVYLDTYTNIKGKEELIKAIRLVWASRFNNQAEQYWKTHEKEPNAIVVQKMVLSEKGIVVHSENPGQLIIRAFWGQTGFLRHLNPDAYKVNESTEEVISRETGQQKSLYMLDPAQDTFAKKELPTEAIGTAVLNDEEITKVTRLMKKIRGILGHVSVEMSLSNGVLSVVNVKDNVVDTPYANSYDEKPMDIDDFIGLNLDEKGYPEQSNVDKIIDKYISINPALKDVFELLRRDLKEVQK